MKKSNLDGLDSFRHYWQDKEMLIVICYCEMCEINPTMAKSE